MTAKFNHVWATEWKKIVAVTLLAGLACWALCIWLAWERMRDRPMLFLESLLAMLLVSAAGSVFFFWSESNRRALHADVAAELSALSGRLARLSQDFPRVLRVMWMSGAAGPTLKETCDVCAGAAQSLNSSVSGVGPSTEIGPVMARLRGFVRYAMAETGMVEATLNPEGVRLYKTYLQQLKTIAGRFDT